MTFKFFELSKTFWKIGKKLISVYWAASQTSFSIFESKLKFHFSSQLIPLPEKTPDNYNVTIIRLIDDDADKIIFNDCIKAFYLGGDLRLVTVDEIWSDGEVPIFDMNNVTLRHLTKVVFQTMRLFMKYSQEAHPVVVRQIHVVNCSSLLNRIMLLVKPFLKAEVAERIQTHLPGSKTIFKYVSKEILPKEYGGTAGSIETTRQIWLQNLENHRWEEVCGSWNWVMSKLSTEYEAFLSKEI